MKHLKYLFSAAYIIFAISAFSQDYKPFRVGIGWGLVPPQKVTPGFLFYVEPSLRITNTVALGARVETMGLPQGDIGAIGSYTLNGQYYLTSEPVRFFVGAGGGLYTTNRGWGITTAGTVQSSSNLLGFYPRFGFDIKHFVVTVDYNIIHSVKQRIEVDMPVQTQEYYTAQPSYLSLKLGFFLGGGKK